MTSVLPRGVRARRGARRPGWALLTILLVLAIAASSVLVFTSRVELLKLAVIVALWAAVVAAFASMIYRRQSEVDQARARDLKLVYDLQLDREISARREYELTVESQLRRELASELRTQAADEVAALRTELAALRTNLEILFDTDFNIRPALEPERTTVRAYSDWARSGGDSMSDTRIVGPADDVVSRTVEYPIIDVPEVKIPATPMPPPIPAPAPPRRHRRAADTGGWTPQPAPPMQQPAAPPQPVQPPPPVQPAQPVPPVPPPPVQPVQPVQQAQPAPPVQPAQPPRPPAGGWPPPEPRQRPEPVPPAAGQWQPAPAEGAWLPPGAPGSNRAPQQPTAAPPAETPAPEPEHRSRHGRPAEAAEAQPWIPATPPADTGGGRRRAPEPPAGEPVQPDAPSAPPSRHAGPDAVDGAEAGPPTGGQSVADLLARLQPAPTGGRRRRRED